MLIRLDDESFADDFCAHFWRASFTVERAGGSVVEIRRFDAPSPDQERRELDLHLRVWRATNPGFGAEIIG
jgi:hypothetical protein